MAFCPVVASSTSSTSCGRPSICLPTTRRIFSSSRIRWVCVCSRPAVSTMSTSKPRAWAFSQASWATLAGIAALLALDDLAAEPLAPDGQLLDGRGPEGVAGGHHHLLAVVLEALGQLGDRGRLARAVDAGDHDDGRPGGVEANAGLVGEQLLLELLLDERLDVAGDLLVEERLADAIDDVGGGAGADVGEVEALLQLGEEVLIDLALEAEQRPMPVKTPRVLARPCLILSKMARKTMNVTS